MVRSTWELLHNPAAICAKLSKAAAKINKPKARGKALIWDLPYLHEYIFAPDQREEKLRFIIEDTILVLRASTGWRSGDLAGLYDVGCEFVDDPSIRVQHGVNVRLWDTKARKGAWTPSVFLPKLAPDWKKLCAYSALKTLIAALQDRDWPTSPLPAPGQASAKVDARRLMVYEPSKTQQKAGNTALLPLGESTIGTYFKKAFLENMRGDDGEPYANTFGPHSARHAVASALADMAVPSSVISGLTLNSATTLDKTYICQVTRNWTLPLDCIKAQGLLPVKLLLPFVHYTSTGGDASKPCGCAKILP